MSHLAYSRSLTATTGFLWTRLANENLYLTCFSINSGLTHTNICGCIQLLNDIWYSVLPGSNDCMVHTNKLELVSMWHTSDSDGAYSRVPYYYDSGILLELHQWIWVSYGGHPYSQYPTIPIYHLTWEFIVLLSRHPTSPVVHSVVSDQNVTAVCSSYRLTRGHTRYVDKR